MGKVVENKHWIIIAVNKFNELTKSGYIPEVFKKPDLRQWITVDLVDSRYSKMTPDEIRQSYKYNEKDHRLELFKLQDIERMHRLLLQILIEVVFGEQLDEGDKLIDQYYREIFM